MCISVNVWLVVNGFLVNILLDVLRLNHNSCIVVVRVVVAHAGQLPLTTRATTVARHRCQQDYVRFRKQRTPGSPSKSEFMVQSVAWNCWAVAKMMLSARESLWSTPSLAAASARPLSSGTIRP